MTRALYICLQSRQPTNRALLMTKGPTMVDLNTPQANDMTLALLVMGPVGFLTVRAIHAAMVKSVGQAQYNPTPIVKFASRDITLFMMTLLSSVVVVTLVLNAGSLHYLMAYLSAARTASMLGWVLTIVWWMHCIAPMVVATFLLIGRRRRKAKYPYDRSVYEERGLFLG